MKERYSTYKSSGVEWIGEIPKHWELVKLGHHISILSGFPFKSELFDPVEGFPILRIRDITSGKCETFYKGEYTQEQIVSNNDLLVGMDGDFTVRWWEGGEVLLNQRCCCVFTNSTLSKRFLYYTLPDKLKIVNDLTYYTTVKHLSNDDIRGVKINLPPLPEQEQIVKYLDEKTSQIDNLISITEKKIELLKQKRTSLINEVVTKGLNPDVELKYSGVEWIGEIPSHWTKSKLKYDVVLTMGQSPESENYNDEGTGTPFLQGNTEFGKEFPTPNKWTTQVTKLSKKGDILYSVRGSLGEMNWSDREYCIGRGLCSISPFNLNPKFNFYLLKLLDQEVKSISVGSTFQSITIDDVKNLFYFLPPLSEQEQIVEYIDTHTSEIDKLVSIEKRRIETLKEYRQSLISEVVTGKVRVCDEVKQIQES